MGATLRYAKVVDRDHVQAHGGLTPSTDNLVTLADDAPAVARDFLVLRAWDVDTGGFEETWRIEDAHGHAVYRGTPRTVLAEHDDIFDRFRGCCSSTPTATSSCWRSTVGRSRAPTSPSS